MIDRFNASDLKLSKEVQEKLDAEGIILVKEDDLSCMEDDYKEACDRLMTIRQLAKDGKECISSVDDTNDQDDLVNAYGKFEDIIYEVES